MPQYDVSIVGPDGGQGTIRVNASDPDAAVKNASQGGNTPISGATLVGGTGGSTGGGGGGGGPSNNTQYTNVDAGQQAIQNAMNQAYQVYLNAKLQLDSDDLAFRKATEAFNESVTTAGLTGVFNGQPTQTALQNYA